MTIFKATALAPLAFLFLSVPAHAELLQTWRLAATTYQDQGGRFTPPSFVKIGQKFSIDYVIDTEAPSGGVGFNGVVKSFSINGITSLSDGYLLSMRGIIFNAINVGPSSARADGINFISFNNFSGTDKQDITSLLAGFAAAAPTSAADLRVDFGVNSIWAHTNSFVMTSVPEPTSALLMLIGLPLLMLRKYRLRSAGAYSANAASSLRLPV
ncbi:hypothetical protein AAKU55_001381 [Oxalobacteraceae bacterium GrIS 1.11]